MARRFNPLDTDSATLCLFGTDYRVAEATRAVMRRIQQLQREIDQLGDEPDEDAVVDLLANMIENALVDGAGTGDAIRAAWQNDDISLPALVRTAEFVGEELRGSATAGEA
jgi:hypothetical protein